MRNEVDGMEELEEQVQYSSFLCSLPLTGAMAAGAVATADTAINNGVGEGVYLLLLARVAGAESGCTCCCCRYGVVRIRESV